MGSGGVEADEVLCSEAGRLEPAAEAWVSGLTCRGSRCSLWRFTHSVAMPGGPFYREKAF